MKRTLNVLILLIFLTACGLLPGYNTPTSTPVSEGRCGDGVCEGPENAQRCPEDCAGVVQSQDAESSQNGQDSTSTQPSPTEDTSSQIVVEVFLEGSVTRDDGEGTCGSAPWGVDHIDGGDFTCPPPKYWFGYQYEITAHQQLYAVPQGEGWVFTPKSNGGGTYQKALGWSDGNRVCEPVSIEADPFDFDITGAAANGEIALEFVTNPVETASWMSTSGSGYERETTLVQIDLGLALSGVYDDLSVLLTKMDRMTDSRYRKTFELDTNPSPNPRDHVDAVLTFSCMTARGDDTLVETACPW